MDTSLVKIRTRKLLTSLAHPSCWRALKFGVAPSVEHFSVLNRLKPDGIIDVGANRGQFALACRLRKPGLKIVAFEPIQKEADVFRKVHGDSPDVTLFESALGEYQGSATLHLSQSADSSSLLPIGRRQTELFANTGEVGLLTVNVNRLDDHSEHWVGKKNQLLKIDVQGFELSVLKGGLETLETCAYAYIECSEVALYDGQPLRTEVSDFLATQGFREMSRYNCHFSHSQLIQADYLFERISSQA